MARRNVTLSIATTLVLWVMTTGSIPWAEAGTTGSGAGVSQASRDLATTAQRTWKYFIDGTKNATGLPADRIDLDPVIGEIAADKTSPTNIGMYLMSLTAAKDLGLVSSVDATKRLNGLIQTLNGLGKWNGFLYNWYDVTTGRPTSDKDATFVSTVDNGWYAAGLIVARQAFPNAAGELSRLLNVMDFSRLYDPAYGQMYGGYDPVQRSLVNWHYGNLNTESRVADYIAIGEGKVPSTLWWKVYRTLPASWTWQRQVPAGPTATHDGLSVIEGHYQWQGVNFVPSWGGSMFEALMPTLVLNEQQLAPNGFGANDLRMVQLQIKYALSTKHYGVWGISPCALPDGGYGVYGVPPLGTSTYEEKGVITPHATFLALNFEPAKALSNLQQLKRKYHMFGPLGYYDSVNVHTAEVTKAYLALDEGMILVAIDNFEKHGRIQMYFNRDPIGRKPQSLLSTENMFIK